MLSKLLIGATSVTSLLPGVWTAGGGLLTSRLYSSAAGSQTDSFASGSYYSLNAAEKYNGTTWTSIQGLITGRFFQGSAGTTMAGVVFAGMTSFTHIKSTEEYDGTSWTQGGLMSNGHSAPIAAGSQLAALSGNGTTEEYDGTAWAIGGNMLVASGFCGGGGANCSICHGRSRGHHDPRIQRNELV